MWLIIVARNVIIYKEIKKLCLKSFTLILKKKMCFQSVVAKIRAKERKIQTSKRRTTTKQLIQFIGKTLHPCLQSSVNRM